MGTCVACVLVSAQMEHKQHYPKNGWVEHDPIEIWENTKVIASN
jgi:glycerol kinase